METTGRKVEQARTAVSHPSRSRGELALRTVVGVERVTCARCGHTFSVCADWRDSFPLTECICGELLGTHRPVEGESRGNGQEPDSLGQPCSVTGSAGNSEPTTTIDTARLDAIFCDLTVSGLLEIIYVEREMGYAFGVVAEACRAELAKRGEQA